MIKFNLVKAGVKETAKKAVSKESSKKAVPKETAKAEMVSVQRLCPTTTSTTYSSPT